MHTCLKQAGAASVAEAARLLRAGEVVGIPTETVYGLAANALSDEAVPKIFAAKGRPQDNPLISHIASLDMLPMVVREVPGAAYRLAEAFWPGPLTLILPRSKTVADSVCAGLDTCVCPAIRWRWRSSAQRACRWRLPRQTFPAAQAPQQRQTCWRIWRARFL